MFIDEKNKFTGEPLDASRLRLKEVKTDTASNNRRELIALLRNPASWPKDFAWNYAECMTCAIGLLCATGTIGESPQRVSREVGQRSEKGIIAQYFGLTPGEARMIFWRAGGNDSDDRPNPNVSAAHIADLIDGISASRLLLQGREASGSPNSSKEG